VSYYLKQCTVINLLRYCCCYRHCFIVSLLLLYALHHSSMSCVSRAYANATRVMSITDMDRLSAYISRDNFHSDFTPKW